MTQNRKDRLWVILGIVILLGIASFYLYYLNRNTVVPASWGNEAGIRSSLADWLNTFQQALLTNVITAVLGILILRRFPRHPIGWLLILISLVSGAVLFSAELTVYTHFTIASPPPGAGWIAWVTNWIWIVLFALLLYMVAVFPNGRFVTRSWQITLTILLAWFTILLMAGAIIESPMSSAFQIANPIHLDNALELYNFLFLPGLPAMPITAVALVISAVVRFRRGQGRERQQMKWLLAGVVLMAFMVLTGLGLSLGAGSALGELIVNASIMGPVLGIGVALLRHQLYDIDIIIRRTLVYFMVSALLALVYFGSVVILQGLATAVGGQRSNLVVAVSTLMIAALFNPVRRRVQKAVDRRFYRRKYNAAQTLNRFAVAARDEVDMDKLNAALLKAIKETMYPQEMSIWLKTKPESTQKRVS
jgi:hypothetical protein